MLPDSQVDFGSSAICTPLFYQEWRHRSFRRRTNTAFPSHQKPQNLLLSTPTRHTCNAEWPTHGINDLWKWCYTSGITCRCSQDGEVAVRGKGNDIEFCGSLRQSGRSRGCGGGGGGGGQGVEDRVEGFSTCGLDVGKCGRDDFGGSSIRLNCEEVVLVWTGCCNDVQG